MTKSKPKKLYRSRDDSKIAGVCGGLGDYLTTDSTVIRLIFIFALLLGGSSILAYLILWLVMPLEPTKTK